MSTKGGDTRERLLVAARRLLAERGYFGVGIEQIARDAGVTRQAVYEHHFSSKAELLIALLDYVDRVEDVGSLFRPVNAEPSARKRFDLVISAIADLWPRVQDIALVLDSARRTDAAAEIAWQSRAEIRRKAFLELAKMLAKEGALAPGWSTGAAADLLLMVLSAQMHRSLVVECGWTRDELVARMKNVLAATLLVPDKRTARKARKANATRASRPRAKRA